jgi:hypothetical protein
MLSCKRHRLEKDVVCRLNSPSPITIVPQLSYHQFEPIKLDSLSIRKSAGVNSTCRIEMRVSNPNQHFFIPESLSAAEEQRISGKTRKGVCDREWKCGGENDRFSNGRTTLMVCSNAFLSDVSYVDEDELTLRGMSAKTSTSTHLGRNVMILDASMELDPSTLPKHDFCGSQGCTWANITMPIRSVSYRWDRGSIWCDPRICDAIGVLVPMTLDE